MKNNIPTTRLTETSKTKLQNTWFQLIENLYQSITEKSELECATRCSAQCCPKVKTSQNDSNAVGHVAIMLPFEMEYILEKTNINPKQLQHTRIEFTSKTPINIGFMTSEVPCPFLTSENKCGIYDIRPLDCRSFPLIPFFKLEGGIDFRVENKCPSMITFSTPYQTELKKVWAKLLPNLPMTYRRLYNEL